MKLTVERISDGIAVLEKEDMTHLEVSINSLPDGVKEGNVLIFDGTSYSIDPEAEARARERIISKQRSIFKKR
ncbi:MAG: DUF3006 domain-containing protein [Ruminococcaceae bacterium]|nr:DUF3006 domain-containing protein [Oscillospiraceae bacterium]